jgi:hypothetical protein
VQRGWACLFGGSEIGRRYSTSLIFTISSRFAIIADGFLLNIREETF